MRKFIIFVIASLMLLASCEKKNVDDLRGNEIEVQVVNNSDWDAQVNIKEYDGSGYGFFQVGPHNTKLYQLNFWGFILSWGKTIDARTWVILIKHDDKTQHELPIDERHHSYTAGHRYVFTINADLTVTIDETVPPDPDIPGGSAIVGPDINDPQLVQILNIIYTTVDGATYNFTCTNNLPNDTYYVWELYAKDVYKKVQGSYKMVSFEVESLTKPVLINLSTYKDEDCQTLTGRGAVRYGEDPQSVTILDLAFEENNPPGHTYVLRCCTDLPDSTYYVWHVGGATITTPSRGYNLKSVTCHLDEAWAPIDVELAAYKDETGQTCIGYVQKRIP